MRTELAEGRNLIFEKSPDADANNLVRTDRAAYLRVKTIPAGGIKFPNEYRSIAIADIVLSRRVVSMEAINDFFGKTAQLVKIKTLTEINCG